MPIGGCFIRSGFRGVKPWGRIWWVFPGPQDFTKQFQDRVIIGNFLRGWIFNRNAVVAPHLSSEIAGGNHDSSWFSKEMVRHQTKGQGFSMLSGLWNSGGLIPPRNNIQGLDVFTICDVFNLAFLRMMSNVRIHKVLYVKLS